VGLQGALIAVALAAGVLGPDWSAAGDPWLDVAGGVIVLAGIVLLLSGITGLGRQLTPFPRPVAGAELRRDGAYGLVRHPMYGGALLIVLGWALLSSPLVLLPLGLAGVFLDAKRRREEAWLVEEHPDYPDYRLAVPRQFIPWVW
jgi:protein-S-isoprenylcysteine O-methyltransferase Ste14